MIRQGISQDMSARQTLKDQLKASRAACGQYASEIMLLRNELIELKSQRNAVVTTAVTVTLASLSIAAAALFLSLQVSI